MNQVTTQEQRPRSPLVQFKHDLDRLQNAGELALPDTVPFKSFKNAAVVAITDNPSILSCKPESVFKAVRTLAAAGLVPDGREAAIVPFKGSAQAMPMVAGLVKVARNSGKITSLWAEVVYEGESLEIWVEDGERKWNHVKEDGSRLNAMSRGGKIIGAYAVAKLSDGTVEFQPMSLEEIEARRKSSANQKSDKPTGIWLQWYGEMAKKTVIRNLCKRLPMSADDMERLMKEQDTAPIKDVTPDQEPPRMNLAQRLAAEAEAEKQHDPEPAKDQDAGETIDGEVIPDEPEQPDEGASAGGSFEFDEGMMARKSGARLRDCPYDGTNGSDEAELMGAWINGYNHQKEVEGQTP